MDLYLLAELKTIALKITTVDMLKPPPDFRSNFDSTPPPILIDAGVAILENEKGSHIDIDGSLSQPFLSPCPIPTKAKYRSVDSISMNMYYDGLSPLKRLKILLQMIAA